MLNFCACSHRAAPSRGSGVGTGAGEFTDPHGGGGGREQRRQRHRRPGEQTSGEAATARTRTSRGFIVIFFFFHTALFSAPIFSAGGILKRLEKQIERRIASPSDATSVIRAGPSARSFSADFVYHAARLHHRAPWRGAQYLLTADTINCPCSAYLPIPGL